ncbi:hypothetical protein GCM10027046_39410 [Uliginosibacterium flavum]|uniref:Uncharacterized protein n=1 Tax=Uliginosibacterium flavum TaxID=1396831 RepID=A0ABV2TKL3_9RHOO
MKNYFKKITAKNWIFATSIYLATSLLSIFHAYSREITSIRNKSTGYLGGDVTSNLDFFDVMKSADYSIFAMFFLGLFMIFIPYLIISAWFFDFKTETHAGWARVFISMQVLIPLIALFYGTFHDVSDFIFVLGLAEFAALILIKLFVWIRDGFSKPVS